MAGGGLHSLEVTLVLANFLGGTSAPSAPFRVRVRTDTPPSLEIVGGTRVSTTRSAALSVEAMRHFVNTWFGDKHKNLHHSPDDVWHKPVDGDADVVADADATDVKINVDGDRGEKGALLRPPREDDDSADVVLARDGARDDADEAASKLAPTPSLEFGGDADVALGPPPPLVADAWTFGESARVPAVDVDSAGSAVDDLNFLEGTHNYEADDADEAESETVPTLRLEFGAEGDDANDADSDASPTLFLR